MLVCRQVVCLQLAPPSTTLAFPFAVLRCPNKRLCTWFVRVSCFGLSAFVRAALRADKEMTADKEDATWDCYRASHLALQTSSIHCPNSLLQSMLEITSPFHVLIHLNLNSNCCVTLEPPLQSMLVVWSPQWAYITAVFLYPQWYGNLEIEKKCMLESISNTRVIFQCLLNFKFSQQCVSV